VLSPADSFLRLVDSAYPRGRIAASIALVEIFAVAGRPLVAINLMHCRIGGLTAEMMSEELGGGMAIGCEAGCRVIGAHTVDDEEPKDGMAVTGTAKVDELLRNDAAEAGLPLTLTKPIGLGLLNNRHKATGEVFQTAIDTMTTLNKSAAEQS